MLNRNIKLLIKQLVKKIFLIDTSDIDLVDRIITQMRLKNGLPYTYRYMKTARLHITRYMCGSPLYVNADNVSLTNGFPTKFLFLRKYCNGTSTMKRYVLTLMMGTKAVGPENKREQESLKVDTSPITDDYKGTRIYTIPAFFIDVMKRKYKIKTTYPLLDESAIFLNMKNSPSGPSTRTSGKGMLRLSYDQMQMIINLLGEKLEKLFIFNYNLAWNNQDKLDGRSSTSGKLSIVHDAEGKERIIAMLDYGTQVVLKPIHDEALSILKRIPMDRTYSQDPFNDWKEDGHKFWSLDLSSATDRFPIYLQTKIVKSIFGPEVGRAWEFLLTDRSYEFNNSHLKYKVGQPMGAYSSGAIFALTHHMVVQGAAYKCGFRDFRDYILLGDDIVIKNNDVAQQYMGLMKIGGVEISKAKTHVSKDTYEFAKRGIQNSGDSEISPLPLKGISQNGQLPKVVYLIVNDWSMKTHYGISNKDILTTLKESYQGTKLRKQWVTPSYMSRVLDDFGVITSYIFKTIRGEDLRNWLGTKLTDYDIPNNELVHELVHGIINLGVEGCLSKTNKRFINLFKDYIAKMVEPQTFKIRGKSYTSQPLVSKGSELSQVIITPAIFNQLRRELNFLESYDGSSHELTKLIEQLVSPGIDEIISLKREERKIAKGITQTGNEGIADFSKRHHYMMKLDNGLFAGYSDGVIVAKNTIDKSMRDFDKLVKGVYKDPEPEKTVSMEDQGAAFFATS